ncbi:MAG: DUF2142 domain-containing protein [Dongiaceae bacterium]
MTTTSSIVAEFPPRTASPDATDGIQAALPWLFLIYAVPAMIFLAITMAPFQVPDELAHAFRAEQIGHGKLISDRYGGEIQGGLDDYGELYRGMWTRTDVKQTVELAGRAGAIACALPARWVNFQNTAQYGPLLYLPQAIGLRLGCAAGLTMAQAVLAARLLNGAAACLLGFLALRLCRRGQALMFATLLLPMTLSQLASVSQDALLIAVSFLGIAVASRPLVERRPASTGEFRLYALMLVATMTARPVQIVFLLLLPVLLRRGDPRWLAKLRIAAVAAALLAAWIPVLANRLMPMPPDWSIERQLALILDHPLTLPSVIANTFGRQASLLLSTVVGRMGWMDTPMPHAYYLAAGVALALALLAPGHRGPAGWRTLLGPATLGALTLGVCAALYLTWTAVGQATINTLQGRYILPALPLLAWPVPAWGARLGRGLAALWYPVLLFPLVSLAVLPPVIMERFYGDWTVMADSLRALLLP